MNIAFVKRVIEGVTYSRVELTPLGHIEFSKTLEGTDETVEDFLHMEDCQRIPNMDKQGWFDLSEVVKQNPRIRKALCATYSWVRIKGAISR